MTETSTSSNFTAFIVACCLSKLARIPAWSPHLPPDVQALNSDVLRVACDNPFRRALDLLPARVALALMDAVFIPGMAQHFLFRKKLVERQVRIAITGGARQVLILGSGLDTLAVRLASEYPNVQFVDVDRSCTVEVKRRAFDETGCSLLPNLTLLPMDLAVDSLDLLCRHVSSFSAESHTIVVLEAVLMYLREREVADLFCALNRMFAGRLSVLFGATVASDDSAKRPVRWINSLLRKVDEATAWHCESARIPKFVANCGYALRAWISYKQLQRHYRPEAELAKIPEQDENYYLVERTRAAAPDRLEDIPVFDLA